MVAWWGFSFLVQRALEELLEIGVSVALQSSYKATDARVAVLVAQSPKGRTW